MKLYYSPMACSLADHIALIEAGASFERESVDLKTKRTASGADFAEVTQKGYVPTLVLNSGAILTENVAILDWIASQYPALGADGMLGRTRVIEALTYISTEVHRAFKPMWHEGSEAEKAEAIQTILMRLDLFAAGLEDDYLFGNRPTVADFYLFVMLLWAKFLGVHAPRPLDALRIRVAARPAVREAMLYEGLFEQLQAAGMPDAA